MNKKSAIAIHALDFIKDNDVVGFGQSTTMRFICDLLAEKMNIPVTC